MEETITNKKEPQEDITKNHTTRDGKESVQCNWLLRKLIKDRGYKSEKAFAETLNNGKGISHNHLSFIIYYKRKPSFALAREICDRLGVKDTRTLFEEIYELNFEQDGRLGMNRGKEE